MSSCDESSTLAGPLLAARKFKTYVDYRHVINVTYLDPSRVRRIDLVVQVYGSTLPQRALFGYVCFGLLDLFEIVRALSDECGSAHCASHLRNR